MQRFDCLAKDTKILGPHFLEASAGTGKTFAIEHVVARLILSGKYELEQILVVTFTRAAARELKLRIRSNLERLISHQNALPEYLEGLDLRLLHESLATFDRCQIFTIHSFCSRMLNEFSVEAGLENFGEGGILEGREAGIRDFFESRLSTDLICPEQLEILVKWAGSIEEMVHLLKTAETPEQIKTFAQLSKEFKEICQSQDLCKLHDDWQVHQGNYKKVKGDLEGQIQALMDGNFAKLIQEKGSIFQFISPENKKVRAKEPSHLHYPEFFKWGKVHLFPLIQYSSDPKEILAILSSEWKPIERKILLEEGSLSNDELLHSMQIAANLEAFQKKVQKKYTAVLIDEFQDTDPVQWDIFAQLFMKEGGSETIYLIGDPKQSIYRFRKADLYTYLKAKESISFEGHFYLDTNFRSSGELISALNHLFDRKWLHLPRDKTTIPYIPVRAGLGLKTEFQDGKGAIHCVLIPKEEIFAYVAREMLRMKEVVPSFRDWAVLVKDRFEAAEMQRVLTSVGIPSSSRAKEPLSETLAFGAIRELLKALENPGHLGMAKRVLAGPFGDLSPAMIRELEFSPFREFRKVLDEKGLSSFFQVYFRQIPKGDQQFHSDCLQVLEHLFAWEQSKGFSFDEAFRFFDSFARRDRDEAVYQRKDEGDKDVQIMTVHMSKGLEFEIVFALGLASRTPPGDEEAEAEKLRQLYVATTRAKRRLYIPIPITSKSAAEGTHAPMELFCQLLSQEGKWEEELIKISSLTSLSYEKIHEPIFLEALDIPKDCLLSESVIKLPTPFFQPSYLLSFTALTRGIEQEVLDPLPEGELPRGAETGVIVHKIFERIFSEKGAWKKRESVSRIIQEELVQGPLALWGQKVDEMVQACLDLRLAQSFCLRDLEVKYIRPEIEFMFESKPHFLKGFIDLLFKHEGKLFFLDWKTNWLKNYTPEQLQIAIVSHRYDLQASIYSEALRRCDLEATAIYLFVRGPSAVCFEPNGYKQ